MTAPPRPLLVRLYAALVRLLPEDLRSAHGSAAEDTFLDLYRETRRERGWLAGVALWLRSSWLLLSCAIGARRENGGYRSTGASHQSVAQMARDIRYSLRALAAAPGFALTAVLIIGLGIGATTTIFSVVDTVVLRPLPYPDAGRLIHFDDGAHSFPSFMAWRELDAFESVAAARDRQVDLLGEGPPQRLNAVEVSAAFLRMFGAAPALGRLLNADDFASERPVAVLDHSAWMRLWGADAGMIGRTIRLDGSAVEIVGILSPGFSPPEIHTGTDVSVWLPLTEPPDMVASHSMYLLGVVGRLQPGGTLEAAQAQVDAQRADAARLRPEQYMSRAGEIDAVPLVDLRTATVGTTSSTLYLLLGAVSLMLLIACANVASLLLARGMSRTRELALRKALGASGGRLAALVLTESMVLALAGGILGIGLTYGGVALFTTLNPGGIPRIDRLAVDVRVLGFALAVSLGTGVVFGLFPAIQARYARIADTLKLGAASTTTGRSGRRTRYALVVAELALALVLLSGAGLLFRSFVGMVNVDPGFETAGLHVVPLSLTTGYDTRPTESPDSADTPGVAPRTRFITELVDTLENTRGIDAVGAGWTLPFSMTGRSRCCWRTRLVGDPALDDDDNPFLSIVHPVTHGYFGTLGVPMLAGRDFTGADEASRASVTILNQPAAIGLFGSTDVVGRPVMLGDREVTVVGVIEGVHHWGLDQDVERGVYVPYATFGYGQSAMNVLIRSSLEPGVVAEIAQGAINRIDAALPTGTIATMEDRIGRSVARPRFLAALFATFAGIALLLAGAGLYGSMVYAVGQRRREMGIRIALGAGAGQVLRLVLKTGLAIAAVGVGLGLVAAHASTHLMTALIWGVEPGDPTTLAGVAAVLSATALVACLVPAWRASRTDPLETLRS